MWIFLFRAPWSEVSCQKSPCNNLRLEADPLGVFHEPRFLRNEAEDSLMQETGEWGPYITFRVCTPSPQLSRMLTKVTLQMLHGSGTHMYWLQSLWQGTTSYTWNTHSSQGFLCREPDERHWEPFTFMTNTIFLFSYFHSSFMIGSLF